MTVTRCHFKSSAAMPWKPSLYFDPKQTFSKFRLLFFFFKVWTSFSAQHVDCHGEPWWSRSVSLHCTCFFSPTSSKHCLGLESSFHNCLTTEFIDGPKMLWKWIKWKAVFKSHCLQQRAPLQIVFSFIYGSDCICPQVFLLSLQTTADRF